jgi:hypothetical protein
VPSQQLQDQIQKQHSVEAVITALSTNNYITEKVKHKTERNKTTSGNMTL